MKFWELTSAFRSETANIEAVLKDDRWKKYQLHYNRLNTIIEKQDRAILDEEIPFQLAKEICELSTLKFYLYYKRQPQVLTSFRMGTEEAFESISSFEILIRFGGSYIEEVLEKTYSEVMPRQIGDDIEVLAAYDITALGILAFLRTEKYILKKNDKIISQDGLRQWSVIEEPFMTYSYKVVEKMEHQKEQGIRQYKLLPLTESRKPQEGEVLKFQ